MSSRRSPAASFPSTLAGEERLDPFPWHSALRILVVVAVLGLTAARQRFHSQSKARAPPRRAVEAGSVCHRDSFHRSGTPTAAQILRTSSPPALLLPPAPPVPVAPGAESFRPAVARWRP